MTDRDLYAETIAGLIEYYGGHTTVARILNVTVQDLERWCEGKARPPTDIFLRVIDLKEQQKPRVAAKRR